MPTTMMQNMIDPEVMGDMVSAKLPAAVKISPFAKIDNTLTGVPGTTITIPCWKYIGDAEDVAEAGAIPIELLTTGKTNAKIKKAGKGIEITDEAILSGLGDPIGQGVIQLTKAIASKVDNDCMDILQTAPLKSGDGVTTINYNGVVDAVDLFEEEDQAPKVIFIHPKQVTQLRKDPDFKDLNKYPLGDGVIMTGVIGQIAGCQVVPSKKVPKKSGKYSCPIVKLVTKNEETEDETPALTIFMKRDILAESDRDIEHKLTKVTADEHYVVALTNESKVVLAQFAETAPAQETTSQTAEGN